MSSRRQGVVFNCFSPPVMMATMTIEVCLAAYTIWRYKFDPIVKLATVTLLMLASFQLAEFFVCTGSIGHDIMWSRIGFSAITVLPPLGLHLMHRIAGKPIGRAVQASYITMVAFIVFFLAFPGVFQNYQCTGNYVVFRLKPNSGGVFWIFYMGWLFTAMVLGARWANEFMRKNQTKKLNAIRGLIIGWMSFIVPTAIANIINPASRNGIPSVMCGFAVLFAVILVTYILPKVAYVKPLTNRLNRLSLK
jgi:hypothetical protein